MGATEGIDHLLDKYQLDALVVPTERCAAPYAAMSGYVISFLC